MPHMLHISDFAQERIDPSGGPSMFASLERRQSGQHHVIGRCAGRSDAARSERRNVELVIAWRLWIVTHAQKPVWALCDRQRLNIVTNIALFTLNET